MNMVNESSREKAVNKLIQIEQFLKQKEFEKALFVLYDELSPETAQCFVSNCHSISSLWGDMTNEQFHRFRNVNDIERAEIYYSQHRDETFYYPSPKEQLMIDEWEKLYK